MSELIICPEITLSSVPLNCVSALAIHLVYFLFLAHFSYFTKGFLQVFHLLNVLVHSVVIIIIITYMEFGLHHISPARVSIDSSCEMDAVHSKL